MPVNLRSSWIAARPVVPLPANGSRTVPREILAACCECALAFLDGVDPEMELKNLNVMHQGFAAVRQTYDTHRV